MYMVYNIIRKRYYIDVELASEDSIKMKIKVGIDILTGYVVDLEVGSNLCVFALVCERERSPKKMTSLIDLVTNREEKCALNHNGCSNSMEVAATKI